MSIKIEEYEQYNVKGYTLQSIIECAYRFGRMDERHNPSDDKLVESMEQVMKMLEGFDSFKEINADKHK